MRDRNAAGWVARMHLDYLDDKKLLRSTSKPMNRLAAVAPQQPVEPNDRWKRPRPTAPSVHADDNGMDQLVNRRRLHRHFHGWKHWMVKKIVINRIVTQHLGRTSDRILQHRRFQQWKRVRAPQEPTWSFQRWKKKTTKKMLLRELAIERIQSVLSRNLQERMLQHWTIWTKIQFGECALLRRVWKRWKRNILHQRRLRLEVTRRIKPTLDRHRFSVVFQRWQSLLSPQARPFEKTLTPPLRVALWMIVALHLMILSYSHAAHDASFQQLS